MAGTAAAALLTRVLPACARVPPSLQAGSADVALECALLLGRKAAEGRAAKDEEAGIPA